MRVVLATALALWLFLPIKVQAETAIFTDSFAGELSWYTVRNASHHDPLQSCLTITGIPVWEIVDGAVQINISGSLPCSTELLPLDTAGRDLRSYAVELRMFVSEPKMDRNLLLRWRDSRNHLGFHLFGEGISVEKIVSGRSYPLHNANRGYNFVANRWYQIRLEQDLSTREVKLFIDGQLIMTAQEPEGDPQLEWGKPGLAASVGAVSHSFVRFDDFVVYSLEGRSDLAVENVKQTDARWSQEVYDQAESWSKETTIKRWGCALSAGVAVLRYHGIDKLPDERWLEPGTLNDWLKNQPDGYIPGGGVNWRALTRLSQWHAQAHNGRALEMTFENPDNQHQWLRQKIDDQLPVILAQPGHFVTAYGYGPGAVDINIADPFYPRLRLSEYNHKFLSARLFTPSNTDLSAVTIAVPLDASLTISDQTGQAIAATEIIEYPLDGSTPYRLFDLAKPRGEVVIRIESLQPMVPVWLAAYDSTGLSQIHEPMVSTVDGAAELTINPHQLSVVNQIVSAPTYLDLAQLSALYNGDHLLHPALIELVLDYQQRLSQTTSLDDAHSLQRLFNLVLQQARLNGWIDDLYSSGLQTHFAALLLAKYP